MATNIIISCGFMRNWRSCTNALPSSELNQTCFVFIVGLSYNDSSLPYNGDVKREALIYHDIVQLNINETYQNVVYKEVGALKWSHIYAFWEQYFLVH